MKKNIVLIILIFLAQVSFAQLGLSGEIRPRAEYRNGYRRMPGENDSPAGFVIQRTRLNLDFQNEKIRTYFSVQDVRNWGQVPQKVIEPAIDIHEAWVELSLMDSLKIKAGRQHLQYDNQRFLAINNWIQQGQKHDVLLIKYHSPLGLAHLGTAFNQEGNINQNLNNYGTSYAVNNYKHMNFLWLNGAIHPGAKLSLLGIAEGYQNNTTQALYVRATYSAYYNYQPGNIQFLLNPGFQHGRRVEGEQIEAWYLRVEIAWSMSPRLRSTFGGEFISGNDQTRAENKYRQFDLTLGGGHAHNGFMDYFTNFPNHTRGAGLLNPFLKNRFRLSEKSVFDADFHLFYLSTDYLHENRVIDRYLGMETDLTFSHTMNAFAQVHVGYSVMLGTPSMEIIKGGNKDEWAHWAYVMLTVKPRFLFQG